MGTSSSSLWLFLLRLLCATATASTTNLRRPQVFGFSDAKAPTFRGYDWSLLTTSSWKLDPELVALAYKHDAVVEMLAPGVNAAIADLSTASAWVSAQIAHMKSHNITGINFDLEQPLKPGSQGAANYTALVTLTAREVHEAMPGSQVSVDIPWSPYDIDSRSYDWHGLAAAADLLFIMIYDTQSQILGRCIASANSPIDTVHKGVQQWLDLGIPADKLVLGLPWYGYDYPCLGPAPGQSAAPDVDVCKLPLVPFRGVSCSDAAGAQKPYFEVMNFLSKGLNTTPVLWDEAQHSPYFNYRNPQDGLIHQVWYDNPESLAAKFQVASDAGLAGVGMWNLDCLDYSSADPLVQQQTAAMWATLKHVVDNWGKWSAGAGAGTGAAEESFLRGSEVV